MEKKINMEEDLYLMPDTSMVSREKISEERSDSEKPHPFATEERKAPKKAEALNEIRELREGNRKVFRMSDGTEQAVYYPSRVHTYDAQRKEYRETDNTLKEDGRRFVCEKDRFTARFSREEETDELFTIERGMYSVTVSARKTGKNRNKGVDPKWQKEKGGEKRDTLLYENVEPGTTYEYSVTGDGVKENILVTEKRAVYQYPFILHCENVTAEFDRKKKRIGFRSHETGEELFCIPTPFMSDAAGAVSGEVFYEMKHAEGGDVLLTVTADSDWINAEERVLPVTIDPQIKTDDSSVMTTYSWNSGTMSSSIIHSVGTSNSTTCTGETRLYMNIKIPTLPNNPRIKKAELVFTQSGTAQQSNTDLKIGMYRVAEDITIGANTPLRDNALMDYQVVKGGGFDKTTYAFDITQLMDEALDGGEDQVNLVLEAIQETTAQNSVTFFGSGYSVLESALAPNLCITYESGYGVNTTYRTHTHDLGRFGQGSVDLQSGSLMFETEDFAWAGNRMPVTLKHLYTSALASYPYSKNPNIKLHTEDFSDMQVGYGWKLNVMQSMAELTDKPLIAKDGENVEASFVYMNENSEELYFTAAKSADGTVLEKQFVEIQNGEITYNSDTRVMQMGEETYQFNDSGRLVSVNDGHNTMRIGYYADLNKISSVTDGACREFRFDYSGDELRHIVAPDGSCVEYRYTDHLLTQITYPGGKKVMLTYTDTQKPASVTLKEKADTGVYKDVYKVEYTFTGDRVTKVTEYGVDATGYVQGVSNEYAYSLSAGKTTVQTVEPPDEDETESTVLKTVYAFDDEGNVLSQYVYTEDTGNVGAEGETAGIHPYGGDGGANTFGRSINLLKGHHFNSLDDWTITGEKSNTWNISASPCGLLDRDPRHLVIRNNSNEVQECGVYQETITLPAGSYTFSAYANVWEKVTESTKPGAFLRVTDQQGNILGESERLDERQSGDIRLTVSFDLLSAAAVKVYILEDGCGTAYIHEAQLENNPYAGKYNRLENGNFELSMNSWQGEGHILTSMQKFDMDCSLNVTGDLNKKRYAYQDVKVIEAAEVRETFTLSGWAKGNGLPVHERNGAQEPTFRLRAQIRYEDGTVDTDEQNGGDPIVAQFSPAAEDWQYASVQFAKNKCKKVDCVRIYCEYDYNYGNAFFDNLQLVRDSLEKDLTASDFEGEPTEETSTASAAVEATEENGVKEDTGTAAEEFKELTDEFGNALTETTFTDGEFGTIYRSFGYGQNNHADCCTTDGNDLQRETDASGNTTHYCVDADTSRNEEITDRCGNKTAYEYDSAGRTTKVISKKADGTTIAHVSYDYDAFDNLTEIVRGDGMKYVLKYNAFHNLQSIGIEKKPEDLVTYTYKNGNGRLKAITYANGDTMKAVYNGMGQMVAERWYNKNNLLTAHYKYVYDDEGNIVRSIDMTAKREYTYAYEEGRLSRAAEYAITVCEGEVIAARSLINSIQYTYDADGDLKKKTIMPTGGTRQDIWYERPEEGDVVTKFTVGSKTVLSHSKTDAFGRKVFDELQLATGTVSRQFTYRAGEITDEHKTAEKIKSTATTQLVKEIVLSDDRTLTYDYDAEERITKVTCKWEENGEIVTHITEYAYDALGQLRTETVNGTVVNEMTYDGYGNIVSKNGKQYCYDEVWRDKLTCCDGQVIRYDAQGNPISYLDHTLTWEKGRQLKTFDNIQYTYNANGIRTSKTVDGVKHEFVLDGTKILRETWGENTLTPLYDNEESVCGIVYNKTPYYFLKNLQGDIVAITDKNGEVVARYNYDAWGVCTVTQDTSACRIATVNPFRYRGYYYDGEIGMYYLQSRYYDPVVGRFVNGDDSETISHYSDAQFNNLFTYCENDPVNGTDYSGTMLVKKLAEIFLSAVFGVVLQLFTDLAIYLVRRLVYGQNAVFNPKPGDYVEQALSWALDCLNPFSKKKRIIAEFIVAVLFSVIKQVVNFIAGYGFNLRDILGDAAAAAVSLAIKQILNKKTAKEISKLKKHHFKNRKALKTQKLKIKAKYKILGQKINLAIDIPTNIFDFVKGVVAND